MSAEPTTFDQAVNSEDGHEWKRAMQEEYDSLIKNGTWKFVDSKKGQRIVDNRWVHRIKRNSTNEIDRYKARLVGGKRF